MACVFGLEAEDFSSSKSVATGLTSTPSSKPASSFWDYFTCILQVPATFDFGFPVEETATFTQPSPETESRSRKNTTFQENDAYQMYRRSTISEAKARAMSVKLGEDLQDLILSGEFFGKDYDAEFSSDSVIPADMLKGINPIQRKTGESETRGPAKSADMGNFGFYAENVEDGSGTDELDMGSEAFETMRNTMLNANKRIGGGERVDRDGTLASTNEVPRASAKSADMGHFGGFYGDTDGDGDEDSGEVTFNMGSEAFETMRNTMLNQNKPMSAGVARATNANAETESRERVESAQFGDLIYSGFGGGETDLYKTTEGSDAATTGNTMSGANPLAGMQSKPSRTSATKSAGSNMEEKRGRASSAEVSDSIYDVMYTAEIYSNPAMEPSDDIFGARESTQGALKDIHMVNNMFAKNKALSKQKKQIAFQ